MDNNTTIINKDDTGLEVEVNNAKLYPTYDAKAPSSTITGTYYIYNTIVKNNRVRLTDDKDKVGKPCQMTGWVDLKFITIKEQTPGEN